MKASKGAWKIRFFYEIGLRKYGWTDKFSGTELELRHELSESINALTTENSFKVEIECEKIE